MVTMKLFILLSFVVASQSIGRKPTKSDHTLCQKVYAKEYNDALNDEQKGGLRLKIEAYNVGKSGSPCKTTCRFVGKIQKKLDPINSPDNIKCGPDMYCHSGKCVQDTVAAASQDELTVCEEDTTNNQTSKVDATNTKVETLNNGQNAELANDQSVKEENTDDASTKQESTKDESTKEETTDNETKNEEKKEVLVNDESANNESKKEENIKDESDDKVSTKDESTREETTKEENKEESSSK